MQEYIKELQEKVGLTEEQATKAVAVLIAKIKSKVPESLQGMVDNVIGSQGEEESLEDKIRKFQGKA